MLTTAAPPSTPNPICADLISPEALPAKSLAAETALVIDGFTANADVKPKSIQGIPIEVG